MVSRIKLIEQTLSKASNDSPSVAILCGVFPLRQDEETFFYSRETEERKKTLELSSNFSSLGKNRRATFERETFYGDDDVPVFKPTPFFFRFCFPRQYFSLALRKSYRDTLVETTQASELSASACKVLKHIRYYCTRCFASLEKRAKPLRSRLLKQKTLFCRVLPPSSRQRRA